MPNNESGESSVRQQQLALAMMLIGVVLTGVSFAWSSTSSSHSSWTNEQALKYQAASTKLHGLSHKYEDQLSGSKTQDLPVELQDAMHEYRELRQQLDDARSQPQRWATVIRSIGILLAIVGATVYFAGTHK